MEGNLPLGPTGCHLSHLLHLFWVGTVVWRDWGGGGGRGRNNTTHLHKRQAHTSLSPSGIHVDESFILTINITFMFIVTNILHRSRPRTFINVWSKLVKK